MRDSAAAMHGQFASGLQCVSEVMARVRRAAAMTSTMQRPSAGERLCRAACPASSALPLALLTMNIAAAKNDCVKLVSGSGKTEEA